MSSVGDYLTVLQLGVGLNLVVGAYASHRREFEEKVAEELDLCREQADRVVRNSGEAEGALSRGLQNKPIKELTARELSRCLGDASIRFHRRVYRYGLRDGYIEAMLMPIGLVCAVALITASAWPLQPIDRSLASVLSVLLLAPPLFAFARTAYELKDHQWHYRRQVNDSYAEKTSSRHDARMRSEAKKGEIHRISNEVRQRAKLLD